MKKYLPFLEWMFPYNKENLSGDLFAGLTVGVMLVPQGLAYAMLAGMPPIYGLYAVTIPLIIYALLGTSRQLSVGPIAMVALLIASGVSPLATTGSDEYVVLAILLALMVGSIQFVMGVFKLGFLVNFLARPVIAGFTSAAAFIIGFSQLKHLLGIQIPRGMVHETILAVVQNFSKINAPTLALGVGSIAVLLFVKRIHDRIPGPLVIVLLGIALVYFLNLEQYGVRIIREVPGGLPSFIFPEINAAAIRSLTPIAFTISFVGFMSSIAISKAIQSRHKDYQLDPNQELRALGMANIAGSFFQSFPVTGGISRTAVNDQAGAKTGLASLISAALIIISLLFLTTYFYFLPYAVLAAIIMVAVYKLVDVKEAMHLWKHDKKDFLVFTTTFLATLLLGIEEGIIIGVILSLTLLIRNVSYPHYAELGKVPGSAEYRNIHRFDDVETYPDIFIIRFDAQLFFANAKVLQDTILEKIDHQDQIKHVIVESTAISNVDSSSIQMIKELNELLIGREINLYFTNVKGPVRDKLKINGLLKNSNKLYYFLSTQDAVDAIHNKDVAGKYGDFTFQTQ